VSSENSALPTLQQLEALDKFLVVRPGFTETKIYASLLTSRGAPPGLRYAASTGAGIFPPTNKELKFFCGNFASALREANFVASWGAKALPEEAALAPLLREGAVTFPANNLDPVSYPELFSKGGTWLSFLTQKRVLVIHPFTTSIDLQAKRLGSLHEQFAAPDMSVTTWRPPMTQGLEFGKKSYSYNLEKEQERLSELVAKNSFDVALVSAGAYGAPIANFLFGQGLSSIHVGGCLQLLFGIMGNRWRDIPAVRDAVTNSWLMHPLERPPKGGRLVEGGTYW
jgi:hypothetical protein